MPKRLLSIALIAFEALNNLSSANQNETSLFDHSGNITGEAFYNSNTSRSFPNLVIYPPHEPLKISTDTNEASLSPWKTASLCIAVLAIGSLCLAVPILLYCMFVKKCGMNTDDRGIDLSSSYEFITSNADNRSKDLPPSYSPPPPYSELRFNEESPNLRNEANGDYETENREQQPAIKLIVRASVIEAYNTDGTSRV